MKVNWISLASLSLVSALALPAQNFSEVSSGAEKSVETAVATLAEQRSEIAEAKIPLAQQLNQLQAEVIELRREAARSARLRDSRGLDLTSLEADVKARREQVDYIASLSSEYISSLETRSDPAELPGLHPVIDAATVAMDNPEVSQKEQFAKQLEVVSTGIERLGEILGGKTIEGSAVSEGGSIVNGTFLIYGPATYFSGGGTAGVAVRGESGRSSILPAGDMASLIAEAVSSGSGSLPLDPTLGKAIAIASTEETITEHIAKGGFWVYPILGFALVSLAIGVIKFMQIISIKSVNPSQVRELVKLVRAGKQEEAIHYAKSLPDPTGEMLLAGVENADEPKELVEEILLEKMTEAQPKLDRLLSVIALTAATAPLLGLLGTVTGMINTFKLITIFGTGDAKSLSSGISEALITTEFGLIVAIPFLILHAFLSRQAKGILAKMETTAMTFVNGLFARRDKETSDAA
jgi:biopolymer transport protein ExbB